MGTFEVFEPNHPEFDQTETDNKQHNFIFNRENLAQYREYLTAGVDIVSQTIQDKSKPFSGVTPHELAEKFAAVDLDTPLSSLTDTLDELKELYLNDAVYFHHPKYVGHLNCPVAYPSLLAEQILTAVNSSVDTWDQSAGGTLIEQSLIDWSIKQIGMGKNADGIFTSGGTQSNLMAMLLARDALVERLKPGYSTKERGLPEEAKRFRIFTSQASHFSVQKSAALLGLGYDAVVSVETDDLFKMDAEQLHQKVLHAIENGFIPMAVVATAGTTDFGSIDPLNAIADICSYYNTWFHVDAAYGCGLLASPTRREKLNGIERADSVTVDYHKSFLQPVSCSAFFANNKKHLEVVTHHADYLNPLCAKQEGTPNLVNKSLQTTRRFDALKMWLTLRIMGKDQIGQIFDEVCALARDVSKVFVQDRDIEVIHEPELSTLVFRFNPGPKLSLPESDLDHINVYIRREIFRTGEAVISATKVDGKRFLKFTLLNPTTELHHIEDVLGMIKHFGYQCIDSLKTSNVSASI
ncbi:L-2,4-diaminobutyrate decarboxylase [Thalassocella blandensis]|nr:L-2,4-diaminobutyrate decarboxylase [Thalassocella blandensis]